LAFQGGRITSQEKSVKPYDKLSIKGGKKTRERKEGYTNQRIGPNIPKKVIKKGRG